MKSGAFILSLLFVGMSIQPAFIKWNNVSCIKKVTITKVAPPTGCCKKPVAKTCPSKKEKKQEKQQAEDPCNTCNPFMACAACPYLPEESQEVISPMVFNAANTIGINDLILSDYEDDSWHPPELFLHF